MIYDAILNPNSPNEFLLQILKSDNNDFLQNHVKNVIVGRKLNSKIAPILQKSLLQNDRHPEQSQVAAEIDKMSDDEIRPLTMIRLSEELTNKIVNRLNTSIDFQLASIPCKKILIKKYPKKYIKAGIYDTNPDIQWVSLEACYKTGNDELANSLVTSVDDKGLFAIGHNTSDASTIDALCKRNIVIAFQCVFSNPRINKPAMDYLATRPPIKIKQIQTLIKIMSDVPMTLLEPYIMSSSNSTLLNAAARSHRTDLSQEIMTKIITDCDDATKIALMKNPSVNRETMKMLANDDDIKISQLASRRLKRLPA